MGILNRFFGSRDIGNKRTTKEKSYSIANVLIQQNVKITPKSCQKCNSTYMHSEGLFVVMTSQIEKWVLDVGGFCPSCRRYICQHHILLGNVDLSHHNAAMMTSPYHWGAVCESCQTALQPTSENYSGQITILLDADELIEKKPEVKSEFQSKSGKISLMKVVQEQMHLTASPQRCKLCHATYAHIPRPIGILTKKFSATEIEVDLGGYCSSGCGNICHRHAKILEIEYQGKQMLSLCCARHGIILKEGP
jgi:hypothetical protein